MSAYAALEARFRRLGLLSGAAAMLHWDWATMMPPGGAEARAAQLAELGLIRHESLTDPRLAALLDEAEAEAEASEGALDDWQRVNLEGMRRRWREAAALPADLVTALSEASSHCEMVWRQARPANDFAAFAAAFAPLLALVREKAAALGQALGCAPYDALIDSHEPGLRSAVIDPLFDDLQDFLPEFLGEVREAQAAAGVPPPPLSAPVAVQQELARRLMRALGFDFEHGRLDVSLHPFCGGAGGDIRITTRYDEDDALSALMAVLHETGHALYEAGLPEDWRYQPVGRACGMALHESQSLLIEMQACRSRPFMRFLAPLLDEHLGGAGEGADAEALYRRAIHVEPGFIRVDADEVTYPAHVMLRYRLERALIAGDLAVDGIPGAWAEIHDDLLGIRPASHAEGCLQDIHWSCGELGYFPSYTVGALMAAQFFDAAARDEPALWPAIERGDFAPLLGWLRARVHRLASRHDGMALLERATGRPLGTVVFKTHLRRRYLG